MHTCTINSDRNVLPSESGDKGTKLQGVNTRDLISSKSSNSSSNAFVHNSSIGVDVHESLMVCVYQKADPLTGQVYEEKFETGTTKKNLNDLIDWIKSLNPEIILMESTGVYWFSFYDLLEDNGLSDITVVVNPREVKAIKGKKTDQIDAARLAVVARVASFSKSFIPNRKVRTTKLLSRQLTQLVHDRQRTTNRMHKVLVTAGAHLKQVFSKLTGVSAQKVLGAILSGMNGTELYDFIEENCKKIKKSTDEIFEAVQIVNNDPNIMSAIRRLGNIGKFLDQQIADTEEQLEVLLAPHRDLMYRLETIPGVSHVIARTVVSELGSDWSSFESPRRLAAWIGLAPGNMTSAGKNRLSRTTKGNKYLRTQLIQAGNAISRMKTGGFFEKFQALKERCGHNKAVVATGHRIIRIMFAMVRDKTEFADSGVGSLAKQRVARALKATRSLSEVGFNTEFKLSNSNTGDTILLTKSTAKPINPPKLAVKADPANGLHATQITSDGESFCIDPNLSLFKVFVDGAKKISSKCILSHVESQIASAAPLQKKSDAKDSQSTVLLSEFDELSTDSHPDL
ncbi:IS110 family transposase [Anaerobiospirillum succiniciproducens]|uniref:IS110 family transposase n=1 Tax=Anaerobiospirillum succiniciproducens TaxID=13335 RepID=UPI00248EAE01|nr:IS110 family transposase [Anaerobiospirillum succiniciproducens]